MLGTLGAIGCGRTPALTDDFASASGSSGDVCEGDDDLCTSIVTLERAADILFVIDNSGSMGQEQGTLAANFASFIEVLEDEDVGASYRIGVTTTDTTVAPRLYATSCRSRTTAFIWQGDLLGTGDIYTEDQRQAGCFDNCPYDFIDIQPTSTDDDPNLIPRPWLQKSEGRTNLPEGISMTQAFQCIGPQGINGDGFESPLEAMHQILQGADEGFLRDDALLAIIFVTDEADCSMPFENRAAVIQRADYTRPLWSQPDRPSSGMCWLAGVTCDGGPGVYDTCYAQDKDWNGQPTDIAPVLYPVDEYIDTLRTIANDKEARTGSGTVLVAVINGVPEGYEQGVPLVYQDSDVEQFNLEYGIGPGCGRGEEGIYNPPGIPPVRLREFAEAFETDGRNMFSICSDDYAIALESIAAAIGELGSRACVPGCVEDQNPNVRGLQPQCEVTEQRPDTGDRPVQQCTITNEGWDYPSGLDVCYRPLSDFDNRTLTPADDMSPQCLTRGANLEFVIERREGVPVPAGTSVQVDCDLSRPPGSGDCTLE